MTIFNFWVCCLFPSLIDLFSPLVLNGWPSAISISFVVALHLLSKKCVEPSFPSPLLFLPYIFPAGCHVQRHHPFHRCFYFCRCCFPTGCHVRDTRYLILSNLLIFFSIHSNFFLNSLVWPYIFFLVRLCLQATNNSFWCARERWVPHLRPFAACFLNCSTSL